MTTMMKRIQKSPKIKKMPVTFPLDRHLPENQVSMRKMAENTSLTISKMVIPRNRNVKAFSKTREYSKMLIV